MKLLSSRAPRCPAFVLSALLLIRAAVAAEPAFVGPIECGRLESPPNQETSGLAASRFPGGPLWTHDDSGGQPVLYAVGPDGRKWGALRLADTKNHDWEDIAAGELDGKPWLVVGDVGDNDAKRSHVLVHFVEEPDPKLLTAGGELSRKPWLTIRIVYEDGPRDCESVAIDARERAVYLLSKREPVPRLYRVPIEPTEKGRRIIARLVGTVPHIPQPTAAELHLKTRLGGRRAQVCAMDFAADGSGAVVLTYGAVLYYPRRDGESWAQALSVEPQILGPHRLPQAEAACFTKDGRHIYVASESSPKLLRYDRR